MSATEVDEYLDRLDEPKRSTLRRLRRDILAVVPDAEQGISYAVPAFKVAGKTIAGFAAFKNHLNAMKRGLPGENRLGFSPEPITKEVPAHHVASWTRPQQETTRRLRSRRERRDARGHPSTA
jgi:hypothetical protein